MVFTPQPEKSKRAHFRAPALRTPPKFHEKTPKREKKERKLWREREKKRENLAPHPSGPHFFWVWVLTPSGPHNSHPHPTDCETTGRHFFQVWAPRFGRPPPDPSTPNNTPTTPPTAPPTHNEHPTPTKKKELAKFGQTRLAKCGQIRMAKSGLAPLRSRPNRRVPPPRGSSSPAPLGLPFRQPPAVFFLRGVSSCRGAPPTDPRVLWIRSPFFWVYVFFVLYVFLLLFLFGGRSDVLSRPWLSSSTAIAFFTSSFLSTCSAEPLSTGRPDVFPGRVHVPPGSLAEQGPQVHCSWQWISFSF